MELENGADASQEQKKDAKKEEKMIRTRLMEFCLGEATVKCV